jgi:hypothetical protein
VLFRYKWAVVYGTLVGISTCLVLAAVPPWETSAASWVTTAGLLLDMLGLAQLEISGVFDRIMVALEEASNEGKAPSNLVRHVIDDPDEAEWRKRLRWWLFSGPKTGVQLIVAGCALQLVGTWLP